jgi:intermediate peptidase
VKELSLYVQALKKVYDPVANSSSAHDPALFPALTVAAQFLSDFEKSGIHLPDKQRRLFVDISDQIIVLGRRFTTLPEAELDADDESKAVPITLHELSQWNASLARELEVPQGEKIYLHANSPEGQAIRREHPDGQVRKRFYIAAYKSSPERLHVLEELLRKRGHLARLVGKRNYAEVALVDKMAKTPGELQSLPSSLIILHANKL